MAVLPGLKTPQQAFEAVLGPNPDYTPLVLRCVDPALLGRPRTREQEPDNRFWDFYLTDEHYDLTRKPVHDSRDILDGSFPADPDLIDHFSRTAKLPREAYETDPVQTFKTFMTWLSKLHRVYEEVKSGAANMHTGEDAPALVARAFKKQWPTYSDWVQEYRAYSTASRHKTHFVLDDLDEACERSTGTPLFVKDIHTLLDRTSTETDRIIASKVEAIYQRSED